MERIETKLKSKLKSNPIPYPDFEKMWSSIQQDEMKISDVEPSSPRTQRKPKRFILIAGLSVALMATPVYAALTYDWSSILTYRAGIQTALEQGLGQPIEQSITKDGFTLTVHTAFTDDNRTFLLYSLKPDASWDGRDVSFNEIGLKDKEGKIIEGYYVHRWNEDLGLFQGYFETDWTVHGQTADVEFAINNIKVVEEGKQFINFDPNNPNTQVFPIQKDGIDSISIQSFEQEENQVLLRSSIKLTDPEMKYSWVRLQAVNGLNTIQEPAPSVSGTPGENGEYLSQQIFKSDTLLADSTKFQIIYDRIKEIKEDTWSLNLTLSKKQLENSSFKEKLNIPVEDMVTGTVIQEMTVTPTQIRLIFNHEKKYTRVPYMEYQLDVGGTLLKGYIWELYIPGHPDKTELRFEMAGLDSATIVNQPISLIAKYRVDDWSGDDNPIRLTDISTKPQSVKTEIAGYPITWTYYMKDNHLYVESLSSDPMFGGVNQTYYLQGKERYYGKPVKMGLLGDGNNKQMDVYENFDQNELNIYIWNYTTEKINDEYRIQLKSGQ